MAETSTMNSDNKVEQIEKKEDMEGIKTEVEMLVKREQLECIACTTRSPECVDIYCSTTRVSGAKLSTFLHKFTQIDLAGHTASKFMCKTCYDLINVLEQAEIEYFKLKEAFENILSKNPLFDSQTVQPIRLTDVKAELNDDDGDDDDDDDDDYVCNNVDDDDSDDEPLATQSKRKRYKVEKKKKKIPTNKRKVKSKANTDSWKCEECGAKGAGGDIALAAHMLAVHALEDPSALLPEVKIETSAEGSQSPLYNNGFSNCLKVELENYDEDDASLGVDDLSNDMPIKKKLGRPLKTKMIQPQPRKKKTKVVHQCDQCDAKYTSLSRLEQHKQKHDGSKPPYICEVCGAHYKHKRACDIHIALHKGISDWKCEECNKLFPSKNALQRHNNIHTGKLNYQCDLCGKSFIHTSSFKMHKLSHSGVKPHACDVCGLALMTRSHLKRHKRVHSGEKRHECNVCGKRFSERYNLAAHSKSHDASETAAAAREQPRRRLFRCTFCPERFERRYNLAAHSKSHDASETAPPVSLHLLSRALRATATLHARAPHVGGARPHAGAAAAHAAQHHEQAAQGAGAAPRPRRAHHCYMLERHMSVVHGRTLERPPPTPRNTMSKLLKAQAQRRDPAAPTTDVDTKDDRSSDSRTTPITPQKLIAQLSSSSSIAQSAWGSSYAAEFLRHEYQH